MQGDYYRYISEYAQDNQHSDVSSKAYNAYKAATEIAESDLKTTHPIRLGLALNYSVFCYEVIKIILGLE
jgi:14-3-3 protein epsilon